MTAPRRNLRSHPLLLAGLLSILLLYITSKTNGQTDELVSTSRIGNHEYVTLLSLAKALSAEIEAVPQKDKVILRRPTDRDLVFTVFSSVYLIGQVQFRAPVPARMHNGQLYLSSDVAEHLGLMNESQPPEQATSDERSTGPKTFEAPSDTKLKERWAIDRIVIDPGHGGKDPGAVGRGGTREKDITLSVAKLLGTLLEQSGLEVVYTRATDKFIKYGRTRIALASEADLYVSLHCNAGQRRAAGGNEVYFLSEAKTTEAAAVAARENAAFELEGDSEEDEDADNTLRGLAMDILSTQYLRESQDLAASIRSGIARQFKKMDDRGVKQANFYMMRRTMGAMPSVLVEMGFISNPKEEKLLKTRSFQKDMAKAIFEGIRSFKQTHEQQFTHPK